MEEVLRNGLSKESGGVVGECYDEMWRRKILEEFRLVLGEVSGEVLKSFVPGKYIYKFLRSVGFIEVDKELERRLRDEFREELRAKAIARRRNIYKCVRELDEESFQLYFVGNQGLESTKISEDSLKVGGGRLSAAGERLIVPIGYHLSCRVSS